MRARTLPAGRARRAPPRRRRRRRARRRRRRRPARRRRSCHRARGHGTAARTLRSPDEGDSYATPRPRTAALTLRNPDEGDAYATRRPRSLMDVWTDSRGNRHDRQQPARPDLDDAAEPGAHGEHARRRVARGLEREALAEPLGVPRRERACSAACEDWATAASNRLGQQRALRRASRTRPRRRTARRRARRRPAAQHRTCCLNQ